MYLVKLTDEGIETAWEVSPWQVKWLSEDGKNGYIREKRPSKAWRWNNYSGAGWSAIAETKAAARQAVRYCRDELRAA